MIGIRRIVVIGASAAGATAAETVRRLDPDCRLTLISDEPVPLYSRCLLSDYLVGHVGRERLTFQRRDWPQGLGVNVVQERAVELDPRAGEVRTSGGRRLRYDGLLLATGASGVLPPIPGIRARGVFVPYRLDQVEAALTAMERAQHVVVLGAGKVGVKAAEAAAVRGRQVTLVEAMSHPLPGVLDEWGAALVRRLLEEHGVRVCTGATITEVHSRKGAVSQVVLEGGECLPCQTLLVAVGVRSNAELARQAGAQVQDGVVVDERMRTHLEGVYAAGDVAEAPVLHGPRLTRLLAPLSLQAPLAQGREQTRQRAVLANWLNAVQQGRVAGYNLAGQERTYPGGIRTNSLRLWDLPIISVGEVEGQGKWSWDGERGVYRRLVLRDQRLVGLLQVGGDVRDVGMLCALVKRGEPVRDPDLLLASGFAHFRGEQLRWALARVVT